MAVIREAVYTLEEVEGPTADQIIASAAIKRRNQYAIIRELEREGGIPKASNATLDSKDSIDLGEYIQDLCRFVNHIPDPFIDA